MLRDKIEFLKDPDFDTIPNNPKAKVLNKGFSVTSDWKRSVDIFMSTFFNKLTE